MRLRRLLERCLDGEGAAWEEFAGRYGRLLEFSARNRLTRYGIRLDDLQMEEVVQQILVHLWEGRKLAQVRDKEKITAWLAAVAGNLAIDCWRKQNRMIDRRKVSLSETVTPGEAEELVLEATLVAEGPSPREEAQTLERDRKLHQALSRLSAREQLILKGAYFLNQSHDEIGQLLGLPRNTVSTAIDRAKKKLRGILSNDGILLEESGSLEGNEDGEYR